MTIEWRLSRKDDYGRVIEFDIKELSVQIEDGRYYGEFRAIRKADLMVMNNE